MAGVKSGEKSLAGAEPTRGLSPHYSPRRSPGEPGVPSVVATGRRCCFSPPPPPSTHQWMLLVLTLRMAAAGDVQTALPPSPEPNESGRRPAGTHDAWGGRSRRHPTCAGRARGLVLAS